MTNNRRKKLHPFGELLQKRLKSHNLTQTDLAKGIEQDGKVISEMCYGKRLGGWARERVIKIITWLHEQKALIALSEANDLLQAGDMADLNADNPFEFELLMRLTPKVNQPSTQTISAEPKLHHNLPHPEYVHFVGRKQEWDRLLTLLAVDNNETVVAIVGMGGVGKSSLALAIAHRYRNQYNILSSTHRFDCLVWISAKETMLTADGICPEVWPILTLTEIYKVIATTLHRPEIIQAPPDHQARQIHQILSETRALLIIDNFETITDEAVIGFVRRVPPPTKIIITTRRRLDFPTIVLHSLNIFDGEILINYETQRRGISITATQKSQLLKQTEGVPLAIAWSIGLMGFGYPVQRILSRLTARDGDLLHFCFEATVGEIKGTAAYTLLQMLALFPTTVSREALGEIANLSTDERDEGLVTLQRLSLITEQNGRFGLLSLTQAFVREGLQESHRQRYIEHYLHLCHTEIGQGYWDGQAGYWHGLSRTTKRYEIDLENMIQAIEWAYDLKCWRAVQDIFTVIVHMLSIGYDLMQRRVELGAKAIAAAKHLKNYELLARFHIDSLAYAWSILGRSDKCAAHLKTGRQIANKYELNDCLANADYVQARLYLSSKLPDDEILAYQCIQTGLAQKPSVEIQRRLYSAQTWLLSRQQSWEEAAIVAKKSVNVATQSGWIFDEAWARRDLAECYLKLGNIEAAENEFQIVLNLASNSTNRYRFDAHWGLARICKIQGDDTSAKIHAQQAKEGFYRLGWKRKVSELDNFLNYL